MKSLFRAHRLIDRLSEAMPLRPLLEARYEKEFAENARANLFRGVYKTFEAAEACAPKTRPIGYDNESPLNNPAIPTLARVW